MDAHEYWIDGFDAGKRLQKGMVPVSDVVKLIEQLLKFPRAEVCRHYVCCNILSMLEANGFDVTNDLAKAVVDADDETALSNLQYLKIGYREDQDGSEKSECCGNCQSYVVKLVDEDDRKDLPCSFCNKHELFVCATNGTCGSFSRKG